ncbi:MAG: AsmA-like C-terminal domain-containing protein, partial [Thermoanaerobaculales bacterium]
IVVTAVAFWRLSRGPISLTAFIPRAEKALGAAAHKGWKFEISAFELNSVYGRVKGSFDVRRADFDLAGGVVIELGVTGSLKDGKINAQAFEFAIESARFADLEVTESVDAQIRLEGDPPVLRGLLLKSFTFAKQEFGGSLEVRSDQGLDIRVHGASIDLKPLTTILHSSLESRSTDTTEHKDLPALDIEIEMDELFGARGVSFDSVFAGATFDGRFWQRAELAASTRPTGRISLVLRPAAEGHSLHFNVSDLGQVVDSLGLATVFRGGVLDLVLEGTSDGPFAGQLVVQDTHLIQSDSMTRLLRMGSLEGLLASFSSSGLNINSIRTNLKWENRQLEFSDLRIHADGLGITANGVIDFAGPRIDLRGALAPTATLQRIIGHIPLLGQVLTGINREGLIATEFSITGPLMAPEVETIPLSTFTPGIFRDLLRLNSERDEPAPN